MNGRYVSKILKTRSLTVELKRLTDEELRYYKVGHSDASIGNEFKERRGKKKKKYRPSMSSGRRLHDTLQLEETKSNCSTKRLRRNDVLESNSEIEVKQPRYEDSKKTVVFDELCERNIEQYKGSTKITSADEIDDSSVFEDEAFIQEKTQEAEKLKKVSSPVNKCQEKTRSCLKEIENSSVDVEDRTYELELKNKLLEDEAKHLDKEYRKHQSKSKRLRKKNKCLKLIQDEMQHTIEKYENDIRSGNSSKVVVRKSDFYPLELKCRLLENYAKYLENECKVSKLKCKKLRKRNKRLKLVQHEMQQKILKYEVSSSHYMYDKNCETSQGMSSV